MQNSPLSDRTLEQLEDEMISLSQRINASDVRRQPIWDHWH